MRHRHLGLSPDRHTTQGHTAARRFLRVADLTPGPGYITCRWVGTRQSGIAGGPLEDLEVGLEFRLAETSLARCGSAAVG